MPIAVEPASYDALKPWRDLYRHELNCQIIHDSLHVRPGWTQSYFLRFDGETAGYGSIVLGGPWQSRPALFEFYILPGHRSRLFDFFTALITATKPPQIDAQSNDPLLTPLLHAFARSTATESILFHDRLTTRHAPPEARVRPAVEADAEALRAADLDSSAGWVVESAGAIAGAGGILFHYNRPYGDIYMKIAESQRQRGLGTFLVQELKRLCWQQGSIPAARCNPANLPSRKTLQKAGFVPCGCILNGALA